MKLKKDENGAVRLYTKACGKTESFQDLKDTYHWRKRMIKHKFMRKLTKYIIKHLAMYILHRSNIYKQHINMQKCEPVIIKHDTPKESTTYLKLAGEHKSFITHYTMSIYVSGYTFIGNSEDEIYLHIIKRLILDQTQIPYCYK